MLTIREVATELRTDPETVRRWCRTGELRATCNTRKKGYSIEEADLTTFLESHPKYGERVIVSEEDQKELIALRAQRDLLKRQVKSYEKQIEDISRQIDKIVGAL